MNVEQPVVVVSGSASGIGRAVVERFASAGWQWYGIDHDAGETVHLRGDVADAAVWATAAREVESRFGRLDALINNAGTNTRGSVLEVDLETWNRILAVNLTSVLLSVVESTKLKPTAGLGPKSRSSGLPRPRISGCSHSRSSSSSPCSSIRRANGPYPYCTMSLPGASFKRWMAPAGSAAMIWVFGQSAVCMVVDTTYLGMLLM